MVRVGVQARTAQECIELTQVLAAEENDGSAISSLWRLPSSPDQEIGQNSRGL